MDFILFTLFAGTVVFFLIKFVFGSSSISHNKSQNSAPIKGEVESPKKVTVQTPVVTSIPESSACSNETEDCEGEGSCGTSCACMDDGSAPSESKKDKSIKILFGTQTGTSKQWAEKLASQASEKGYATQVGDLSQYDLDDLADEPLVVFVVATYTNGRPPENCVPFYDWLDAHSLDWRVDQGTFQNVQYAVFGIGHSIYGENFNAAAKQLDTIMQRLTAQKVLPVGLGDNGAGVEVEPTFNKWSAAFWNALENKRPAIATSDEPDEDPIDELAGEPLLDVEDLGTMVKKPKPQIKKRSKKPKKEAAPVVEEEEDEESEDDDEPYDPSQPEREMLTPSLRQALTKQGYKLLGSHSGVKMCRWTKAQLRGRGGCYKHTFYGIKSYQCMEMTPSLACANKCVFCWRHHKNPVGTEWKWKTDSAKFLIEEALKNHHQMIKQMKGVPGVVKERYDEAFTVKHCALSLVGEPITYPQINEFVDLLHGKGISSFMVTNAQFPDKIDELKPVTQLYISVDAATKESLKKIDRPIFPDFWERFLSCMDSLAKKGQRTVYRLTLVKEYNMDELYDYAKLIQRGKPSFVEVKGVTYCGTSKASTLTMQNVPFHEEVIKFARALCATPEMQDDYELAVEHEHSCAVLICHKKFKVNGVWNTWIDYPKFHELANSGKEFSAVDYMEPTPYWALIGSEERGFDPGEVRFRRNKPYQGSGC